MNIKHFPDLWFTVVAEVTNDGYNADFKVYKIAGLTEDLSAPALWMGDDWTPTVSFAEAELYLHGNVKWDGCSNWHFDEQERVMLHGCSREDLTAIGEVMARCWDWAGELVPHWSP